MGTLCIMVIIWYINTGTLWLIYVQNKPKKYVVFWEGVWGGGRKSFHSTVVKIAIIPYMILTTMLIFIICLQLTYLWSYYDYPYCWYTMQCVRWHGDTFDHLKKSQYQYHNVGRHSTVVVRWTAGQQAEQLILHLGHCSYQNSSHHPKLSSI